MLKFLVISQIFLISSQGFAQSRDFLEAGFGAQEEIKGANINEEFEGDVDKVATTRLEKNKNCTSDDQTSLPLRHVLALLRGKGAVLQTSYDPNTQKLSIYGGPMVGNCNDMLDFYWGEPEGDLPYTFEVRIRRPQGCSGATCKYSLQTIENEKVVAKDQVEFEPSFSGFLKCMEASGVYKDGRFDKDKIVTTELNVEKTGVSKSGKVVFVSKGPEANNTGGGRFSERNLYTTNTCYFYEDIQKGGFTIYTKEEIHHNNLIKEAQSLCKSKDYAEIYGNLKSFENMSSTYKDLEKIMQEQLLKEVAKAKKEFDAAVKKGDLSSLDTEKYSKLFKDYYELIIQKHLDNESHNGADENDMSLLVNLYQAYEDAESKDEKAKIEKQIRDKAKELNKYMQEPYFTLDDYKEFISMKNKAPLKDPLWKEATENMHKALVSLRLTCQAYSVDSRNCSFSDKSQNMKDMSSIEDINAAVASYSTKATQIYSEREYVLKNPDSDNSEDYEKLISDCEKLYSESNQKQMYYNQYKVQYNQMAIQQCRNKNPYMNMFGGYGGYYANQFKSCVEDMNNDFKAKYSVSSTKIKVCDTQINKYRDQHDKWKNLEAMRDKYYYGDDDNQDDADDASNGYDPTTGRYNFSYNPGQMQMPNGPTGMPPVYNPYFQQQNMNLYNPNLYSMNRIPGLNAGFSLNSGLNFYGRQPSMYNPAMMGYSQGGIFNNGMPAPMTNYMGNMSSMSGPYNFNFGL